MLIVCAGFGLFLINALDTPTLMILSGAPAYFVNEANLLDTVFLLYLKGPLISEGPLGPAVFVGALGRVFAGAEGSEGEGCVLRADVSSPAGLEQADKMLSFSQCTP